jgi:ribosomal protein S18 acetylase RimI-like enzyme
MHCVNDKIRFRKAALQDTQRIVELVNSAYRGECSRKGWTTEADFLGGQRIDAAMIEEMFSSASQWILLGERGDGLVGLFNLERVNPGVCYFGMFAIRPDLQSQGIGKRLMVEAEQFARDELGCSTMRMLVITLRLELIAWYERRGYRRTGERQSFPYGNERFGLPLRDDLELEVLEKRL